MLHRISQAKESFLSASCNRWREYRVRPIRPICNPATDCSSPYFGKHVTHKPSLIFSQSPSPRKPVDLSSPLHFLQDDLQCSVMVHECCSATQPVLCCSMATLGID